MSAVADDTDIEKKQETARRSMMAARLQSQAGGKKAGKDAPPVNIGWDSHKAVVCLHLNLEIPKRKIVAIGIAHDNKIF